MQAKQLQPDTTRSFKFTFMKFQAEICRKYVEYLKYVIFLLKTANYVKTYFLHIYIFYLSLDL